MVGDKISLSDLPLDLRIKILRHCDEPTRDSAGKTSRDMKAATDVARRMDYEALAKRPGRWTCEPLPTPIELADRGCPKPDWRRVAKTLQLVPSRQNGPLARFYLCAGALAEAHKEQYAASWQVGARLSQYLGGMTSSDDEEPHKFGVYNAKGERYEGEFESGVRCGHGFSRSVSGGCYEGAWKDGAPNGYGMRISADGTRYEGSWYEPDSPLILAETFSYQRDGTVGLTEAFFAARDGTRYFDLPLPEGDAREAYPFFDRGFEQNGRGSISFADGRCYRGEWMLGKPHGQGTFIYTDGSCEKGTWALGVLRRPR